MNARKFLCTIACLAILLTSKLMAQGPYPMPEQVESFKNTTLLVIADGSDVAFDARLRKAVQDNWTLTEFRFIDSREFEREKSNPAKSFLTSATIKFDRDVEDNSYQFMYILLSHPTGDLSEMPVIAQVPFIGTGITSSNHLHKTDMLVKFLQKHATDVVESNGNKRFRKLNYLNKGIRELENKTLVVTESQIHEDYRDEESFAKVYKYPWKMVADDELPQIISEEEENTVVLHIVAADDDATSGRCFKMIIEPATGNAFFYKTHKINEKRPPVFLKRDFRNIRWAPIHWL